MVERLKQTVLLAFAFLFLLSTCFHIEISASAQTVNNPYELVVATIGEPDTVDPAWADDTASRELILNVYETSIFYDRESVDEFVPMLATEWARARGGRVTVVLGWLGDYPDPHNFIWAFMHTNPYHTTWQRYSDPTVDALIEDGLHTLNETRRREIYYELQQIYFEDCPSIAIYQPLGRHWERTWVQGWYHNPAYASEYA